MRDGYIEGGRTWRKRAYLSEQEQNYYAVSVRPRQLKIVLWLSTLCICLVNSCDTIMVRHAMPLHMERRLLFTRETDLCLLSTGSSEVKDPIRLRRAVTIGRVRVWCPTSLLNIPTKYDVIPVITQTSGKSLYAAILCAF